MPYYDSYTDPPYWEYDWASVNWDVPTPTDVCALAELERTVTQKAILWRMQMHDAGLTDADMPRLSMILWDNVVRVVGLSTHEELNEEDYERYASLVVAGGYVLEDRKDSMLTDDEMKAEAEAKAKMGVLIDSVMEGLDDRIEEVKRSIDKRKAEEEMLRRMME